MALVADIVDEVVVDAHDQAVLAGRQPAQFVNVRGGQRVLGGDFAPVHPHPGLPDHPLQKQGDFLVLPGPRNIDAALIPGRADVFVHPAEHAVIRPRRALAEAGFVGGARQLDFIAQGAVVKPALIDALIFGIELKTPGSRNRQGGGRRLWLCCRVLTAGRQANNRQG